MYKKERTKMKGLRGRGRRDENEHENNENGINNDVRNNRRDYKHDLSICIIFYPAVQT